MESQEERKSALQHWLEQRYGPLTLHPIVPDASFRRYYRIYVAGGSLIAMDAPPTTEKSDAYLAIATALQQIGLHTPTIIAHDLVRGFLLLSDFGDKTLLKVLTADNAPYYYRKVLGVLSQLQTCEKITGYALPLFHADLMWYEWRAHKTWFAEQLLAIPASALSPSLDKNFALLIESALNQPQVFMHRDYHSANLMVMANDEIGVLDFQDAFIGPITYDLVSLLRDCYIVWPTALVEKLALHYKQTLITLKTTSEAEFMQWFDWMGVERHLKALFTFARKAIRDKQGKYLQYVPQTLAYLEKATSQYPTLSPLHDYITQIAVPAFKKLQNSKELVACVQ